MSAGARVWSTFSADPREPSSADLRASDADRDRALDILREAYADGRLSRDEFDGRSASILTSRTIGGLAPTLIDLVAATPTVLAQSAVNQSSLREEAVAEYRRDLRDARNGWVSVTTLTVVFWGVTAVASRGLPFFWPVFPSLGVGVGYFFVFLQRERRIEEIEEKLVAARRRRREFDS